MPRVGRGEVRIVLGYILPVADLFEAFGAVADTMRQVDWAGTPLGPVDSWSPAVRSTVRLMGQSKAAITLMWGPQHVLLYNEAYTTLIADKHPFAAGRPAREVFPEIWDDIGPLLRQVHDGGDTVWTENARLPLIRYGQL